MIYKRLQKKTQADDLTLIKLSQHIKHLTLSLEELKNSHLHGGWESVLEQSVLAEEAEIEPIKRSLNGIALYADELERRGVHNKCDS